MKSATIFKLTIPSLATASEAFEAKAFTEPEPSALGSYGFCAVPGSDGQFLAPFNGGVAFAVQIASKVIPASAVRAELAKRIAKMGTKPGRKERAQIMEDVTDDLTLKALTDTKTYTCLYDTKRELLLVPATSAKVGDAIPSMIVAAIKDAKVDPLPVAELSGVLTSSLQEWIDDPDVLPFALKFDLGLHVLLERDTGGDGKEKIKFDLRGEISGARQGLKEALDRGFAVTELGLFFGGTHFRLSHDFKLRGIEFQHEPSDSDDAVERFEQDAAMTLQEIGWIVDGLLEVMGGAA